MNDESLSNVLRSLASSDAEKKCLQKRPNSRYKFFAPVNVLVNIYSMGGPIRETAEVEAYCKKNSNIVSYIDRKGKYFFFCALPAIANFKRQEL